MPIVAIGAAIVADVVAGSAVAATVGGIAAISATTALEVVAAVGATVGAIGAVTGNKALTIAGGVIGVIGGVGALASSAGLLGSAAGSAPLFGAAPAASATGADAASAAAPAASTADAASTGSAFGGAASDASNAASYGSTAGAFDNAASTADAASSGTVPFVSDGFLSPGQPLPTDQTDTVVGAEINPSNPNGTTSGSSTNLIQQGLVADATNTSPATTAAAGTTVPPPATPASAPSGPGYVDSGTMDVPGTTAAPATNGSGVVGANPSTAEISTNPLSGVFHDVLDFANNNKVVSLGILQAGGSLLTGLTSSLTPAQVSALNAQANANNAAAALTTQQTANLAMPKAVASSAPVTGTPQQIIPGGVTGAPTQTAMAPTVPMGLINNGGAPTAPAPTGVPA